MSKCIQCGKCCRERLCLLGELFFETKTPPCPALTLKDEKSWCGFVLFADSFWPNFGMSEHLAFLLGIGKGCGSQPSDADATELLSKMSEFEEKLKIKASATTNPKPEEQ